MGLGQGTVVRPTLGCGRLTLGTVPNPLTGILGQSPVRFDGDYGTVPSSAFLDIHHFRSCRLTPPAADGTSVGFGRRSTSSAVQRNRRVFFLPGMLLSFVGLLSKLRFLMRKARQFPAEPYRSGPVAPPLVALGALTFKSKWLKSNILKRSKRRKTKFVMLPSRHFSPNYD